MAVALLFLLLALAGCSKPDAQQAQQTRNLLAQGKLAEAQDSLEKSLAQFPDSTTLLQARLHLHLLAGQAELAAADARQILQINLSSQPYQPFLRDPSSAIRALALRAYTLSPSPHPEPRTVIGTALRDPDPIVRREAVEATRMLTPKEAFSLLRLAAQDSDWLTRATAARLFGTWSDPAALAYLFPLLTDRDSYVRRYARRSLLELATHSTPEAYLPSLKSTDRTTQVVAALALARCNDPRGAEILLAEIANPLGIERVEAVKSVARLPDARVLPALRLSSQDPETEIRVVSLIALGLLRDQSSIPLMRKISADAKNPKDVRLAAGKALDLLSSPPQP